MADSLQRSGPWTKQEEEYAHALMEAFRLGHVDDLEEGTSLRKYLAKQLQCASKRVSKKFEGKNYQGKLLYLREYDISDDEFQRKRDHIRSLEIKCLDAVALSEKSKKSKRKSAPTPSTSAPVPVAALSTDPAWALLSSSSRSHLGGNQGSTNAAQVSQLSATFPGLDNLSGAGNTAARNPLVTYHGLNALGFARLNPLLLRSTAESGFAHSNQLQFDSNPLQLGVGSLFSPANGVSLPGSESGNQALDHLFGRNERLNTPHEALSPLPNLSSLDAARLRLLRESVNLPAASRELASSGGTTSPGLGAGGPFLQRPRLSSHLEQQMLTGSTGPYGAAPAIQHTRGSLSPPPQHQQIAEKRQRESDEDTGEKEPKRRSAL